MVTDGRGNHITITGTGRAKLCMVTIYLRNGKGNGEIFLREVGDANVKTIDCSNKIMSQCLNVSMSQ